VANCLLEVASMKLTAKALIPALVAGGTVLGLLAATEVNTRMNPGPEPAWRKIARERAMNAVSYAFVDSGPSDLSPYLPWIGTGPNGRMAPFPEDLHRARAAEFMADLPDVEAELALAEAAVARWTSEFDDAPVTRTRRASPSVERTAARAAASAADLRAGYGEDFADPAAPVWTSVGPARRAPRVIREPVKVVEPAVLDIPMPEPVFHSSPDEDRMGG
jgi:hypothetical protein